MTTYCLHWLLTVHVDMYTIVPPKNWASMTHNLDSKFLLYFWKQWEDSVMTSAIIQDIACWVLTQWCILVSTHLNNIAHMQKNIKHGRDNKLSSKTISHRTYMGQMIEFEGEASALEWLPSHVGHVNQLWCYSLYLCSWQNTKSQKSWPPTEFWSVHQWRTLSKQIWPLRVLISWSIKNLQ